MKRKLLGKCLQPGCSESGCSCCRGNWCGMCECCDEFQPEDPLSWGIAIGFLVVVFALLFFSVSCTQLPSRVGAAVADNVVHDTRSFRGIEKRVDLLEISNGQNRSEMELYFNSLNYNMKMTDRRLEKIEDLIGEKLGRMLEMEEKILNLLEPRKVTKI